MKSGKQRRLEIKAMRQKKAMKKIANARETAFYQRPKNSVKADYLELSHNNTYGLMPEFYIDKAFVCTDCGIDQIWTAQQQKWWYEVIKGNIDSIAKRCRECRKVIREKKAQQKAHMETMAERPPHPHEAFFKKRFR